MGGRGIYSMIDKTSLLQVLATMPFIPSWLVSLPAAAQLLLIQDRPAAAVLLLLAHLVAWYTAADIILREIPSTHPYLTCLGIFVSIRRPDLQAFAILVHATFVRTSYCMTLVFSLLCAFFFARSTLVDMQYVYAAN